MTQKVTGSCLCGKVGFEIGNAFEKLYLCSCSQCRKITGSAYAANLMQGSATFAWTSGGNHVQRFKVPGRDITKAFCRFCGSGLPYVSEDETRVVIPAGALDSVPEIVERYRIFNTERPGWSTDFEAITAFDAFPE